MRLSLRFIIPLFLALGALAYAVVPLVDKLALQWFERDLDLRATLIASTVQEPLRDLIRAGNRTRLLQFFTRISQDERLYAVGFCPMGLGEPIATPTLPAEIRCARLEPYSSPSGQLLQSPDGPLLVSVRSLAVEGAPAGTLVLVHDMSFVARRSAETRKYLFYFFVALGAIVALITVVIAQLSWRGWVHGLRALLRGEGLVRPSDGREVREIPELRPIASDLRALIRDLEADHRSRDEDQLAWTPETLRAILRTDLLGHVDCTRWRLRRSRGGGRACPHRGAAGAAGLSATPRVADARAGGRILLWIRERGVVAVVPYRPRASDLPHVRLGAIRHGQPDVCQRRGGGGKVTRPHRAGPGLPLCASAPNDPGRAARRDHRVLLAHSLAKPRGVRDLPLAGGVARRSPGLEHPRIPHAVSLQQLRRHRRPPAGSQGRPGDVHRLLPRQTDRGQALPDFDRVAPLARPGRHAGRAVPPGSAGASRFAGGPRDRSRGRPPRLHEGDRGAAARGGTSAGDGAAMGRQVHLHPDRRPHSQPHLAVPGIRRARAGNGSGDQRALRRCPASADRAARGAPPAAHHLRVLSGRGGVRGLEPARRHEPGGEGVRIVTRRRARRADPQPVHRRRTRAAGGDHRQSLRQGSVRRGAAHGAVDAPRGAAYPHPVDAWPDSRVQRVSLGGAHVDRRGGHAAPRAPAGPGGDAGATVAASRGP